MTERMVEILQLKYYRMIKNFTIYNIRNIVGIEVLVQEISLILNYVRYSRLHREK